MMHIFVLAAVGDRRQKGMQPARHLETTERKGTEPRNRSAALSKMTNHEQEARFDTELVGGGSITPVCIQRSGPGGNVGPGRFEMQSDYVSGLAGIECDRG